MQTRKIMIIILLFFLSFNSVAKSLEEVLSDKQQFCGDYLTDNHTSMSVNRSEKYLGEIIELTNVVERVVFMKSPYYEPGGIITMVQIIVKSEDYSGRLYDIELMFGKNMTKDEMEEYLDRYLSLEGKKVTLIGKFNSLNTYIRGNEKTICHIRFDLVNYTEN